MSYIKIGALARANVKLPPLFIPLFLIAVLLWAPFQSPAGAAVGPGFPDHVFAPYVDVLLWPTFSLQNAYEETGQRYFTLAFVVSDPEGRPAWGGVTAMEDNWFLDQINFIRSVGGDVIISFGGANGTELALAIDNVADLQAAYQSVINRYDLKWVDFDIEGLAVAHRESIDRRNKAIKGLQAANPDLKIAFCLPVLPQGLTADGLYVLENARDNGVRVDLVNVMAMDYGDWPAPNPEGQMGKYAIDAAVNTLGQALGLGIDTQIGITPMIGQNDVPSERFYVSDAVAVLNWAQDPERQPWVGLLSFWSMNRDNGGCPGGVAQSGCSGIAQEEFEFSQTWFAFSDGGSGGYLPTVSIVDPTDQSAFHEGETIAVIAEAQDPDGQVIQVAFFVNGNPAGTDTLAPFTLTLPGLSAGIYDLTAQATDNDGGTRTSAPVRIFVGDVCTAPQWNASSIYVAGNQVSHNGHMWEAKWWTQNEEPGTTGQWGVWKDLGTCGGSSTVKIKVNGSDGPITVSQSEPVSIEISLDPGNRDGEVADWWIAVKTPFGPPGDWYTYVYPSGWMPGINLCAQAGLFDLAPFEVFNTVLPVGTYTFYFALDDPDGIATGPWWGLDSVEVNVQ